MTRSSKTVQILQIFWLINVSKENNTKINVVYFENQAKNNIFRENDI